MAKKPIVIPREAVQAIAEQAAKRIDLSAIAEMAVANIPKPKDGQDLILTDIMRQDFINQAAKLVPPGKPGEPGRDGRDGKDGAKYQLNLADMKEISDKVRADLKQAILDQLVESAVREVANREMVVTPEMLKTRVDALNRQIKQIKPMNAGISGGDMIEEINKILGTTWQTQADVPPEEIQVNVYPAPAIASLDDRFKVMEFQNGGDNDFLTVPNNADVAFAVGDWIEVRKTGAGNLLISRGTTVTFRGENGDANVQLTGADGFSAFLEKTDTDTWLVTGNVETP
jgi:hypothetical protein